MAIPTAANGFIEIERVILQLVYFCLRSKIAVSRAFADETLKPPRGMPLALSVIKEFTSEKGVEQNEEDHTSSIARTHGAIGHDQSVRAG